MKRLLAAAGLAAVVCLGLILAACTEGVSSPEEYPLSDMADTVSGTVYYQLQPFEDAPVEILYYSTGDWFLVDTVRSDEYGYYEVEYPSAARGNVGRAYSDDGTMKGLNWGWYFPPWGGEVTGIDISLGP